MATTVGIALTADGIKNTVIGLGGLSFGTMISSAGGVAVGAPVAVASGALAVAGAVESAYGATVLLSSARNMGSDMQKLGDAMSSPEDAGKGTFGKNTVGATEKHVPKDIKLVDDKLLKRSGLDAHRIKDDVVGGNLSKYDIYVDKDTGQLWVYGKGGKGEGIPTGEYIK